MLACTTDTALRQQAFRDESFTVTRPLLLSVGLRSWSECPAVPSRLRGGVLILCINHSCLLVRMRACYTVVDLAQVDECPNTLPCTQTVTYIFIHVYIYILSNVSPCTSMHIAR